jgi:flagellar hook-associated protein 1 FlgK
MSAFSVGVSGLNAAQIGIQVTSHNITNASTEGYNRQTLIQSTNTPMFSGAGFIGQGANVTTVQRAYSELLKSQVMTSETGSAENDSYLFQIQQIDNLLGDSTAGLSTALDDFFRGVQGVSANPASMPSRQTMISSAQSLVSRLSSVNERLTDIRNGVNAEVIAEVSTINSYASQIADLNQSILLAQVAGPTQPANDLLDQRDQILARLNKEIRVSTVLQDDGSLNVFVGNGQPLVVGTQKTTMTAAPAPDDPGRYTVYYRISSSGSSASIPESLLTGGKLGGLLAFRSESLDFSQNAIGRIAMGLAQTFNDQHSLGMDINGAYGTDMFEVAKPVIYANNKNADTTQMIDVTVNSVSNLSASDYRITYDGSNYTLTRLEDGKAWASALLTGIPWPVDGITIDTGTWTPVAGDSFLVKPTVAGAQTFDLKITDPSLIAAAAPIRTATTLANTGSASISPGSVNTPPPPDPNLKNTVTLTFNPPGDNFDVFDVTTGTTLASGVAYTQGADITYNGWTVQINGLPNAGDIFTVQANAGGVSDNRNAVLLSQLQTKATLINSSASFPAAYSQMVSTVGNKAHAVEVTGKAQQQLADQSFNKSQELSGVNLDEEAANLLRFQQAYQASAKMISVSGTLFESILSMMH